MSSVPQQYQPSTRLIDDEAQLRKYYCEEGLTIREIATHHAEVGPSRVCRALQEHGITSGERDTPTHETASSTRGRDPPAERVDWSAL